MLGNIRKFDPPWLNKQILKPGNSHFSNFSPKTMQICVWVWLLDLIDFWNQLAKKKTCNKSSERLFSPWLETFRLRQDMWLLLLLLRSFCSICGKRIIFTNRQLKHHVTVVVGAPVLFNSPRSRVYVSSNQPHVASHFPSWRLSNPQSHSKLNKIQSTHQKLL